jgi:MerR family transcriptional regulator, redox-sensitive transcriptional activator SoxR
MKSLSIGEVARRTGVRTSALRYYEDAGILPKPGRINGRRIYDIDTVRRIDVLRFAQRAGFTLEEIKLLFHGFNASTPLSARWQKLARSKLAELETLRKQIERMKHALELGLKCGCVRIEDCRLTAADAENPTAGTQQKGGCSC